MRRAKGIAAIFAGLLLIFRAGAITVSADEGNNGDVKIHATDTATADNRNEPHVCDFYIDGFDFDNGQSGTWVIVGQAPTAGNVGRDGTWGPADSKGDWHTTTITPRLADGHYKLTVNTGKGDGKHKVFWVECGTVASTGNSSGTTTGSSTGNSTTGNSSGTTTGSSTGTTTGSSTNAPASTGVLGFQSGPALTGAVTPQLESPAVAANQSTAVNGQETSPVAGVTSLPSTSTIADNGIWGALGLMLAGLGAFLLGKPQRRLN